MGRLEKIVVLTVLFLVAVILGVSLNRGDERSGGAADPATTHDQASLPALSAPRTLPGESQATPPRVEGPAGAFNTAVGSRSTEGAGQVPEGGAGLGGSNPEAGDGLTGSDIPGEAAGTPWTEPAAGDRAPAQPESGLDPAREAPADATPPVPAAPVSWLVSEEGLQPSQDPGAMLYTWAAGDSFAALAERFYGSRQQVARLHKANEGRTDATLVPGEVVFVPARAPAPDEVLDTTPAGAGQWFGGTYIVESGDILGEIAQRVYGSASKWRLIYEANRDVLASPDALQVGMKLRIPASD